MGQWFERFFNEAGLPVEISGRKTVIRPEELAARNDVIIITVPISATVKTIEEVGPFVRKDALLMDLTSLKKEPVEVMVRSSRGEVIGAHPLFGPGEISLEGNNIVLCPARGEKWLPWLQDIFTRHGAHIEIMGPDEHDRAMSIVQGLVHSAHMAMGACMNGCGFSAAFLGRVSTPNFRKMAQQVERLFSQDPSLYSQMLFHNPHVPSVLKSYIEGLHSLLDAVQRKDVSAIEKTFADVDKYFAGEE